MRDLLTYGLIAFWAGVLLNFVPCVLPVIPIKVRIILKEIKGDVRSRLFAAISLMAGSVSVFLILGCATAYLELAWGDLFRSKWFLAALAVFFLFTAVATFTDRSVRLPAAFYRIPVSRYIGAFLIGGLAGILSTPCTGPFLGSVLAYTLTQPPKIIIPIFISIGCGLAMPYVFLLLWPSLLNRLSFSAAWTIRVKQTMGFVLLAGAVFFGKVLMPAVLVSGLWWIFHLSVIIWSVFIFRQSSGWPGKVFSLCVLGAVLFFMIPVKQENRLQWQEFTARSLEASLAARQPVLIEFTAAWCLNCEVLEKTSYADKGVVGAVRRAKLVPMRIDMTDFNDSHRKLLDKYGGTALPFAVLVGADGRIVRRFHGMFTAKALKTAIDRL